MATMKFSLVLLLACALSLQGVLADIICEDLPANVCAFSVSSSAKRCVLENSIMDGGKVEYQCKTSEVVVGSSIAEYLETDECVNACGVDRKSVGMSSDALLEPAFTAKLCSPACYDKCPNIIDLYFNLASGEGVYLPNLCSKRRSSLEVQRNGAVAPAADTPTRRAMVELSSRDAAAPVADAPAPAANDLPPRRAMVELLSSGYDAPAPTSDDDLPPRRAMVELLSSGYDAPAPTADDDLPPRRAMVELLSSGYNAPAPTADDDLPPRRAMVELLSSGYDAPAADAAPAPATDAPAPRRFSRRAMVELLSSGDVAPGPISIDDLDYADESTSSQLYF